MPTDGSTLADIAVSPDGPSFGDAEPLLDAERMEDVEADVPEKPGDSGKPGISSKPDADIVPIDPASCPSPPVPVDESDVLWKDGCCSHRKVDRNCKDGWCAIPAGCFIIGSPEGEFGRGMYDEELTEVTLTRPFLMQQHEFTCGEWTALGLKVPVLEEKHSMGDCNDLANPIANINWYEALLLANLLSTRQSPPLPTCYQLTNCKGLIGEGAVCESVAHTTPSIYECAGFRLPTEYEWEYAVRAGTRTAFYNGGFAPETTKEMASWCDGEKNLDPIAWNCANSERRVHPVGQKVANDWGLHDMLGNALEWTNGPIRFAYRPGPLTDPDGEYLEYWVRSARGGHTGLWPARVRAADHSWGEQEFPGPGVRLVRTGTENPGPLPGSIVPTKGRAPKSKSTPKR